MVRTIIAAAISVVVIVLAFNLFENLDAHEIMVIQHPTNGSLTWYTSPGIKWQGFGKVTKYKKLSDHAFDARIMFNDNGTGNLKGRYQVEMPLKPEILTALHTKYGSQEAIEKTLVQATINKVIYMTGPLMSSKESSAERKTDLIRYITDQIDYGVYRTNQKTSTVEDPISKENRTVTVAEISMSGGKPERQEESVLSTYGIKVANFAPSDLDYDDTVKKQIANQQTITMEVQTARAKALEAEQRRITAEADGKAAVMKAQYDKEVEKIQAVVSAKQRLEVAQLDAQAAGETKKKEILLGEGEAERKKLVMHADGALEKKLAAFVEINKNYADAIKGHAGPWVPSVIMGTSQNGGTLNVPGGGALPLIDLLTVKTARDLSLALDVSGKEETKQK